MTEIQSVEADVALPGVSGRLWSSRRYLRLRPFDTSTPEGRFAERYRRIAWSTLLEGVGKVISMGTGFISVPLVIGYLLVQRLLAGHRAPGGLRPGQRRDLAAPMRLLPGAE
jgi:hypothetical protein